jgi:hypothetical protein
MHDSMEDSRTKYTNTMLFKIIAAAHLLYSIYYFYITVYSVSAILNNLSGFFSGPSVAIYAVTLFMFAQAVIPLVLSISLWRREQWSVIISLSWNVLLLFTSLPSITSPDVGVMQYGIFVFCWSVAMVALLLLLLRRETAK